MILFSPARLVTACVLAVSCCVAPAFGASDYFLKLEGIDGESKLERGAIDIIAFSHDIKSPRDSASGQATGKRSAADNGDDTETGNLSDISFSTVQGNASPHLLLACAKGKHFPTAILTCRKSGDDKPYLKITMQDCIVSSFAPSGDSSEDRPKETFSLSPSIVTFAYYGGGDPSELIVKFVVKK